MKDRTRRHRTETVDFTASALLDKAKALIDQGNMRRLIVRRPSGRILIDVPLTAGVLVVAVLTLIVPMLMAIAAIAALVTKFRIEIERDRPIYEVDDD